MDATAVKSRHSALCSTRIVVFNKTVIEAFALQHDPVSEKSTVDLTGIDQIQNLLVGLVLI